MIQALDIEKTKDLKRYFIEQETLCQSLIQKISNNEKITDDEEYVFSCATVDIMDRLIKMKDEMTNNRVLSEYYIETAICFLARYRDDIELILNELEDIDDETLVRFSEEEIDIEYEDGEEEDEKMYNTGILH